MSNLAHSNAMGNALAQYRSVDSSAAVGGASGHRLVQLLLQGALDRLAAGRGHMERREHAAKGHSIGRALDILGHLRATLDRQRGAEVAANLESLYLYMETRLVEASARNETGPLEEVAGLLREVKSAWDVIEGANE